LVQFQVQKLQCQHGLQTLRQAYLGNPALADTFQQYNQLIEGLNVKIARETQMLEVNQQLLTLMLAQRLQPGADSTNQLASLLNPQLNSQSASSQPQRGQLRIDQMFSSVPNRSTLSGTGNSSTVQPKEEPK